MKTELKKLLSAKWLMSIGLTGTFIYMCVVGRISAELFIPIYTMIVGTYFGQSIATRKQNQS